MTNITKISLLQFRNYAAADFEFQGKVTCITGLNGSGKTNLLDAVYYLCYTKSYFNAYQQQTALHGTDGFRVSGVFTGQPDKATISCRWQAGKKEIYKNSSLYDKPTDHIGQFAAVMIAPDDTAIINEHSDQRRRWIDSILGQADATYLEKLMRYQKVLQQRNAWLKLNAGKASFSSAELEYYDACMADDGAYIFGRRSAFERELLPLLSNFYHRLSGGNEPIHVKYLSDLQQRPLHEWLKKNLEHDLRYQRTLRGVHKDDLEFLLNDKSLKQFGSQGQKKSFLFALKLAQHSWLAKNMGNIPILLLDDIFEKLDQQRMEALLAIIRGDGFGQVILTDTHAQRISELFGAEDSISYIHL